MDAFKDFARGNFADGLEKLSVIDKWRDNNDALDGPFYLGFPDTPGWGEGLLLASLLKRSAVKKNKKINIFAATEVCSILKGDGAFILTRADSFEDAQSQGARSPLAILKHALVGDLLEIPFSEIEVDAQPACPAQKKARIGIAWASKKKNGSPIPEKSVPIEKFIPIFADIAPEVVSFQRMLASNDADKIRQKMGEHCSFLSDIVLDALDQSDVMRSLSQIDCMLTISTTTAHIAACLGIPTVLLAAKREGYQWFWPAQAEHSVLFYPHVHVILGGNSTTDAWWMECIGPARHALIKILEL